MSVVANYSYRDPLPGCDSELYSLQTEEITDYLKKLPASISGVSNNETFFCLEVNYGTKYQGWPYIAGVRCQA